MLAIQNADGDLRVWSVPKPPTNGIPRVIRILKRSDNITSGRNWVSWSKNGRIIQFSEGETWAWDVRTKDVNYVPIPTVEFVRGVAAHGPTASLFTLGPDSTIQQYDVESGHVVANIRHMPMTVPPTPPEEYVRQFNATSEEEPQPQLRPARYEAETRHDSNSSPHGQSQSSASRKPEKKPSVNDLSSPVRTEQSATTFSMGAFNYAQQQLRGQQPPVSPISGPARGGVRQASRLRQEVVLSPMGQLEEVQPFLDLFPYARARLSDTLAQQVRPLDENSSTPDDLRKHMLNVVFGWEDDIYALIADELQRHPDDSLNALYLTKWLHHGSEAFAELLANTLPDPSLDLLRLALGIMDSRPENKKLGQIFVEKALGKGEIHTAVAVLLAMGDKNDAIEIYVTNNCYLESILLTCLMMPGDWQRQSYLVRRWGEHVVENSQQQLAIRCFACTGVEPAENWVSPTVQMFNKLMSPISAARSQPSAMFPTPIQPDYSQYQQSPAYSAPPVLLNPNVSRLRGRGFDAATPVALMAPPTPLRTAAAQGTRITPQNGGLKLITSFGPTTKSFKFPGLKTEDMTPTNTNTTMVTPTAESAISRSALSPGGLGSYRMNNVQSLNNAMALGYPTSANPTRQRLPSIGETPHDVESPGFPNGRNVARAPPTPADSGSDREKERIAAARAADTTAQEQRNERSEPPLTLLTSARYDPGSTPVQRYESDPEPQTALRPNTDNSWHHPVNKLHDESSHGRTGSKGKKPDGLSLQVLQVKEAVEEDETLEHPDRPGTTDTTGTNFTMSLAEAGDSWRLKSPSVSGRSVDQYISSLEQAQYYGKSRSRNSSRPPREEKSDRKQSKHRKHKNSEGVNERREISAPKRSPSSPVPMSPDDLRDFTTSVESFDSVFYSSANASANDQPFHAGPYDYRESVSTVDTRRTRHRSRSNQMGVRRKQSVKGSRKSSPGPEADLSRRGRSKSRKAGAVARSPSSPMPMVPSEEDMEGRSSVEPALRFVNQNRSRFQRSTSRRPERGTSARRDHSPDRRRGRERSPSRQRDTETPIASRMNGVGNKEGRLWESDASQDAHRSDRPQYDTLEQLDEMAEMIRNNEIGNQKMSTKSKELAQAELEARRLSLARNPSAPAIPMPGRGNNHFKSASDGYAAQPPMFRNHSDLTLRTLRSVTPRQDYDEYKTSSQGRPGTPQAMQVQNESSKQEQDGQNDHSDDGAFRLPARAYNANNNRDEVNTWAPPEPPPNMPRHPAFNHRVGTSRGSSRSRTRASSQEGRRGKSSESSKQFTEAQAVPEEVPTIEEPPPVIIGSPEMSDDHREKRESDGPTIIPELQHLAVPPPPPPPPPPPAKGLRIQTDLAQIASIPLPRSAFPGQLEVNGNGSEQHRRQSSREGGQAQPQFLGKIRGITERMRSNSKSRDNYTRSPNPDESRMSPYETVTMMPPPLSAMSDRR